MRSRGSLSTILAGVLVLVALTMGIIMGAMVLSTITTLSNLAANHVRTVGEESATYSGLIIQGGALVSTKGPVTVIGAVSPDGSFTWINETAQTYTANTTEPQLLLTNVGPVLLDLTQPDTNNQAIAGDPISAYLWSWVTAVITMNNGQSQYTGVVIPLGNQYYLLHVDPNYAIGPLTGTNTYVTENYGAGLWGCQAVYSFVWPGLGNETSTTCPTPGYTQTFGYVGPWPQIAIIPINNTAVELAITFLEGTSFVRQPQYFTLYVLSQDNPQWLNPTCNGQHHITQIPNPNPPYGTLPAPNNCTFNMAWIQFPYQQGTACYNHGWVWCTLPNTVTYTITMNMETQVPSRYYLIMIISYPQGFPSQWFAWNITTTTPNYPTWLDSPGPNATILQPN